jgi:hypothetical protein
MRFRSRIVTQIGTIGTVLAVALLGACSSDDAPDARVMSNFPDARPPSTADAAPPAAEFGATISVQEVALLDNTATPIADLGTGGNISISFTQTNLPNEELIETGTAVPCTAVRYDVSAGTPPPAILDEGTVTITTGGGAATIPPCGFSNGAYRCIGAQGTGGAGVEVSAGQVWTFTDATVPTTLSAADVGRYFVIPSVPGAAFPILGFTAPNQLNLGGPVVAVVPAFITVAGSGPVPTVFNPGGAPTGVPPEFLANDSTVQVAFVPATDADIEAFSSMVLNVGDAWTLDDASKALLAEGVLVHSGNVVIGCAGTGGTCGTATGTIVAIDTTDTATTGDTDFPAPTTESANITCTQLGTTPITLTAAQVMVLKNANPTRIRVSVFRVTADLTLFATAGVGVVAGQGFVKFENAP